MTQATPDPGATIGAAKRRELLPLDEAVEIVIAACSPLPAEAVPLREAHGRVLAEPLRSAADVPPFDNSAMDGYAVRAADTRGASADEPVRLRVVGESRAGSPAARSAGAGEAIAISTGAVLPEGADAVVRVEDTTHVAGEVALAVEVRPGSEVRRAGEDVRRGQPVLEPGTVIGPAELGVAASLGAAEVPCARRPLVSVITTGDELVAPGEALRPGAIRNTNAYAVPAQAFAAGAELAGIEVVSDDEAATRAALERALAADAVVVCGGVSVGAHDHVKAALAALGVEERFWGIALRPGRPTWFGVAPGGALVFGLPGNPVSAMVTFELLAVPAVRALTHRDARPPRLHATLDDGYAKRPGRLHAVRCRLTPRDDGWHAHTTGPQGSHVLTSMLGADGLAMVPASSGDVEAGERVEVIPLSRAAGPFR